MARTSRASGREWQDEVTGGESHPIPEDSTARVRGLEAETGSHRGLRQGSDTVSGTL